MDWGITLNVRDSIQGVVEKSQIADSGGLEYIWIADFPSTKYAPVVASVVAQTSKTSKIGIGLVSTLLYDVETVVQAMSTLIESHGERFELLLGPGDRLGLKKCGISFGEASTIVERVLTASKRIKSGLEKEGHRCPIWLGAQGPKMIEASTAVDGVLLNYANPEMIKWSLGLLANHPNDFRVGIFPPTLISEKMREKDMSSFYYSTAVVFLGLVRSVAEKFDLSEQLDEARTKLKTGGFTQELVKSIKTPILDMFGVSKNLEEIKEYEEAIRKLGISLLVSGPPQGLTTELVESLVRVKQQR
jgi:hypothetical protein